MSFFVRSDIAAGGGTASAEVATPPIVRERGEPTVGQIIEILNAASERQGAAQGAVRR